MQNLKDGKIIKKKEDVAPAYWETPTMMAWWFPSTGSTPKMQKLAAELTTHVEHTNPDSKQVIWNVQT
jgi:hypothetical protein